MQLRHPVFTLGRLVLARLTLLVESLLGGTPRAEVEGTVAERNEVEDMVARVAGRGAVGRLNYGLPKSAGRIGVGERGPNQRS